MLGDCIYAELLLTLEETLDHLNHVRLVDPGDNERILEFKRTLREKIREIEERTELQRAA